MNTLQRKILENLVEEAADMVCDEVRWNNWGPARKARASFAQALLANDALLRIASRTDECKCTSGVAQVDAPRPVVEPAVEAEDAGSSPAPAAKQRRGRPRRNRG